MKYASQCVMSIFIGCAVSQKFVSAFGQAMDYVRRIASVDLFVHLFNQKSICAFNSEIQICFSKHTNTTLRYMCIYVCASATAVNACARQLYPGYLHF